MWAKILGFIGEKLIAAFVIALWELYEDYRKKEFNKKINKKIKEAQDLSESEDIKKKLEGNKKSEEIFKDFT